MGDSQAKLKIVVDAQDNTKGTFNALNSQLANSNAGVSSLTGNVLKLAAGFFTAQKAFDAFSLGTRVSADLETARVGLTTLLGSAEKAAETVKRLKVEAQRTPFELTGLTQATQLLTSVTKDGNKSIDTILNIGEALAAMGKGQAELDRIIINLQQVAAVGHAATIDIKQFAFAGIPIYEMLAETTGKSGQALADLIDSGGVTFDVLTKMFDKANDSGGRFFNAYKNQAGTFNQVTSNLKDAWGLFMADIVNGSGLFDGMKTAMSSVTGVLQNWRGVVGDVHQAISNFLTQLDARTGIVTMFGDVVANLTFFFQEQFIPAWNRLTEALVPLQPLWEAMGQVLGFVATIMAGGLLLGINAVGAALIQLLSWSADLAAYWSNELSSVIQNIGTVIETVSKTVLKLISYFEKAINLAQQLGGGAVSFVKSKLPGRAAGGPVSDGSPYLVGENGPELFVPRETGNIIPNNRMGSMGGSTIINITGTFMSEDAAERMGDLLMKRLKLSNAF